MTEFYRYIDEIFNYDSYVNIEDDNIIYTDTDSVFIKKGLKNTDEIEDIVNRFAHDFGDILNSKYNNDDLFKYKFKVEYLIDTMVIFGKKMYFLIKEDNSIDIVGLEGKKETFKMAKDILNDILKFLIDAKKEGKVITNIDGIIFINNLYNKYYSYINKINDLWNEDPSSVLDMIGFPINISKSISELKAVSSYYRGVIAFDYFYNKKFGNIFWGNNTNSKGYHIYVSLKNGSDLDEDIFKEFNIIKNKDIKDLTIPDILSNNKIVMEYIKEIFIINIDEYKNLINQKISRLGKFLSPFSDKIINNNKKYMVLFEDNVFINKGNKKIIDEYMNYDKNKILLDYSSSSPV